MRNRWKAYDDLSIRRARTALFRGLLRRFVLRVTMTAAGVAGSLWRAFLHWRRRRAALDELLGLDQRTLKDIGLKPGDIGHVADASARGEKYDPNGRSLPQLRPPAPVNLRPLPIMRAGEPRASVPRTSGGMRP